MLGVFQSPAETIREYAGRAETPFELVADPEMKLYEKYGLETSLAGTLTPSSAVGLAKAAAEGHLPGRIDGPFTRLPADFLIDEDGIIVETHYGNKISDHISFERIRSFASDELSTRKAAQ